MPLAILITFLIIKGQNQLTGDFGNYYYAARFLIEGKWGTWIYDPAAFNLAIYETGQRDFFLNFTSVPPLSVLICTPITFAGVAHAKLIWNILNGILLLFAFYRIQTYYPMPVWLWACVPLLFYTPLRGNFYEGQLYILLFYTLTEGYIQYEKGNIWLASGLWALGIHLKIITAVILFFLLLQKDLKAFFGLVLTLLLLMLVSLPFIGYDIWHGYIFNILPRLFEGEINYPYALNYQSAQVLLKTMFVPDALWNQENWFNQPQLYYRLLLLFKLMVLGFAMLCSLSNVERKVKFGVWILVALLTSGYGNSFSLLLLALPLFIFYPMFLKQRMLLVLFTVVLFLCVNLPHQWFVEWCLPLRFPRLYFLIALLFAGVWLCQIRFRWYYVLAPVLLAVVPLGRKETKQNYFFKKEEALLVTDFSIVNNEVVFSYFNLQGPAQKSIPLLFKVDKETCIGLTFSITNGKQKSCVINDSLEIYLSDENRGVGFNTLRYKLLKEQVKL